MHHSPVNMKCHPPSAVLLDEPTVKYNCHSYDDVIFEKKVEIVWQHDGKKKPDRPNPHKYRVFDLSLCLVILV